MWHYAPSSSWPFQFKYDCFSFEAPSVFVFFSFLRLGRNILKDGARVQETIKYLFRGVGSKKLMYMYLLTSWLQVHAIDLLRELKDIVEQCTLNSEASSGHGTPFLLGGGCGMVWYGMVWAWYGIV